MVYIYLQTRLTKLRDNETSGKSAGELFIMQRQRKEKKKNQHFKSRNILAATRCPLHTKSISSLTWCIEYLSCKARRGFWWWSGCGETQPETRMTVYRDAGGSSQCWSCLCIIPRICDESEVPVATQRLVLSPPSVYKACLRIILLEAGSC